MIAALADLAKAVAPVVQGVMSWLGIRKARKEGREQARREMEDQARERADAVAERRRESEAESEERFLAEKRKVLKEGPGSPEDRVAALDRKVTRS